MVSALRRSAHLLRVWQPLGMATAEEKRALDPLGPWRSGGVIRCGDPVELSTARMSPRGRLGRLPNRRTGSVIGMTDRRGQSTEDPAPASAAEAADTIRNDPALNAPAQADALTDDDARTSDTAQSGEVQDEQA